AEERGVTPRFQLLGPAESGRPAGGEDQCGDDHRSSVREGRPQVGTLTPVDTPMTLTESVRRDQWPPLAFELRRLVGSTMLGDHLGEDGHRHFVRRVGAYLEPDRPVDAVDGGFVESGGQQLLAAAGSGALAPHRSYVANRPFQHQGPQWIL